MNKASWILALGLGGFMMTAIAPQSRAAETLAEPAGQVIGFYSKGQLSNASSLPSDGLGFLHLFQARNRGWGSEGLVQLIMQTAAEIAQNYPGGERLQIGDMSAQKGGYISGHASHQNGLDADLGYYRLNHHEQDPADLRGFLENFVISGKISPNFDVERNWSFVKALAATGRLNRIFMGPVIKKALCRHAAALGEATTEAEALRRVQPYPNHDDHMHIRLTCPASSPKCIKQQELPPGSGCNAVMVLDQNAL